MPTKKTKTLKSTIKSTGAKKVAIKTELPEKQPDIKISDDVVSALVNGFKSLADRLDKLVEKVSHISMMCDSFASGEAMFTVLLANNDISIPITVESFRENLEVAVYNKKGTDFEISGSINVDGDLTVSN